MVAKAKHLIKLSNHIYLKAIRDTNDRVMEPSEALMFHYRKPSLNFTFDKVDTTAYKYSNELYKNVDELCAKIFNDGVCPLG
jgi:hypothetical protein